jgi:hypothetical protein
MPKEFKKQFVISVGITLALLAVICTLMFYLQSDVSAKATQISQINDEIISKNISLKNLSDLEKEQPAATPLFASMSALIPSEDMLFSVQHNLQSVAQSDNLAFSSEFGSETNPGPSNPGQVAIEMTLQGAYSQILAFLKSAESENFVSISSIDLIQEPSGSNFNAIITGNIPFHS